MLTIFMGEKRRVIIALLFREKLPREQLHARLAAQFGEAECLLRTVSVWCAALGGRQRPLKRESVEAAVD
jgi:hypothetical protein